MQEEGVKKDDGILSTIQANCIPFTDRQHLPAIISDKIGELNLSPNWRNEIVIERDDREYTDAIFLETHEKRRWYHMNVRNYHSSKIAFDCIGYLESSKDLTTMEKKNYPPIELKWQGLNLSRTIIPPGLARPLDAFYVSFDAPDKVHFGINTSLVTFVGYLEQYQLNGPGTFDLDFVIFSVNFNPIRQRLRLEIGNKISDIKFYNEDKNDNKRNALVKDVASKD